MRVIFIGGVLLAAILCQSARAASPNATRDAATCQNGPLSDRVEVCTRAIASGEFQGAGLGVLYEKRGFMFQNGSKFGARKVRVESLDRGIADFTAAIRANPQSHAAYRYRGETYLAKMEFDKAVADFGEAIKALNLLPKTGSGLFSAYHEGRCRANTWSNRDLNQALADCTAAVADGRAQPINRAITHYKLGKYDEAIADFNAQLKIGAGNGESVYGRGLARLKKGDRTEGQADIDAAKKLFPLDALIAMFTEYGIKADGSLGPPTPQFYTP